MGETGRVAPHPSLLPAEAWQKGPSQTGEEALGSGRGWGGRWECSW